MGIDTSAWLIVRGLPRDATSRELHVLFSACVGYTSCKVLEPSRRRLADACVRFNNRASTLAAVQSRLGTTWECNGNIVEFEPWDEPTAPPFVDEPGVQTVKLDEFDNGVPAQDEMVSDLDFHIPDHEGSTHDRGRAHLRDAWSEFADIDDRLARLMQEDFKAPASSCDDTSRDCLDTNDYLSPELSPPRALPRALAAAVAAAAFEPRATHSRTSHDAAYEIESTKSSTVRASAASGIPPAHIASTGPAPTSRQRAEAQLVLEQAIASKKRADLERAILLGEQTGLPERDLKVAREILAVEDRRAAARKSAASRDRGKVALEKVTEALAIAKSGGPTCQKVKTLRAAVYGAKSAGVSGASVTEAQRALQREEGRLGAQEDLENIINRPGVSTQEVKAAIERASKLGVEKEHLRKAANALVGMEHMTRARMNFHEVVQEQRQAIIEGRNPPSFAQAIEHARAAGITADEVRDAVEALAEERRRVAENRLDDAARGKDISVLHAAIREGVRANLDDAILEDARRVLRQQERRIMGKSRTSAGKD
eukprot:TRINITY_DN25258_c0_g4_i1.p1 TRINITY_DN25258_c0_g4~~TRINITY_DN25258_c0_g4_i1.p1  ORF type:complete len:557 (-),score=66.56 TRINITY_DN25258_c0_g4_i1:268-1893(-)